MGMTKEATRKHLMHLLEQYDKLSLPWESEKATNGTGMGMSETPEQYYNRMIQMHKANTVENKESK